MKHGTGTKACLDTDGEVGTVLVLLQAVSIATKPVWACLHWTVQVCTPLLSCDKQPALYPGLLAPVFSASSANVGYGWRSVLRLLYSCAIAFCTRGTCHGCRGCRGCLLSCSGVTTGRMLTHMYLQFQGMCLSFRHPPQVHEHNCEFYWSFHHVSTASAGVGRLWVWCQQTTQLYTGMVYKMINWAGLKQWDDFDYSKLECSWLKRGLLWAYSSTFRECASTSDVHLTFRNGSFTCTTSELLQSSTANHGMERLWGYGYGVNRQATRCTLVWFTYHKLGWVTVISLLWLFTNTLFCLKGLSQACCLTFRDDAHGSTE